MITLSACPICKSKRILQYNTVAMAPLVKHAIMPNVFVDTAIITRYFICKSCHVIFQNPRMSHKQLGTFYRAGYYRRLINLTDEERGNDEMSRATFDAKIIKEHVGEIGSHLDIGAGHGYLLKEIGAKRKVGVEPDTSYMKVSGIEVYGKVSNVPLQLFDLVTAIHTLEHVPDPVSFLKKMTTFINPNGRLVIEVPTWKSPGGPLRLPHLYHFEPDVLRLMCREVGLHIVETKFTPHLLLICKLS